MRRVVRWAVGAITALVGVAFCVELFSFLVVSGSNYLIYGQLREGSRAIYDPYTLFLHTHPVRPSAFNATAADGRNNRLIWMFGGSTTRGETDFDDRTVPSFLAQYLNANETGLRFTVVNFGTDSFNSLMEVKYLQKLLIERDDKPDLIVFYDGANDVKYFVEHRTPYAHHGYRRAQALIESYYRGWLGLLKPLTAALYASFTRELYNRLNQVVFPLDPADQQLAAMVGMSERRYDFIDRLSTDLGARLILFWQPMLWVEDCPVSASVREQEKNLFVNASQFVAMRDNFVLTYSALASRLAAKPYFVGLRDVFCSRQTPLYRPDGVHLEDEGRRLVAREIGRIIEQRLVRTAI